MTGEEQKGRQKANNDGYFSGSDNPFVSATAFWQNMMTNWLNAYGEFIKNGTKITEYWYDVCWKPWINLQQHNERLQGINKVKVE
ncbi:MAG TPA: hypothetical protein VE643_00235 [Nitrososphaeraceae archaeon]|nr:hypothetical protein [Nitrososphaeraceae archaeon]